MEATRYKRESPVNNECDVPRGVLCGDNKSAADMVLRLLDEDGVGRKSPAPVGAEEWKCTKRSDEMRGDLVEGKRGQRIDFSTPVVSLGEELRPLPHSQIPAGAGPMDVRANNDRGSGQTPDDKQAD